MNVVSLKVEVYSQGENLKDNDLANPGSTDTKVAKNDLLSNNDNCLRF